MSDERAHSDGVKMARVGPLPTPYRGVLIDDVLFCLFVVLDMCCVALNIQV